MSIGLPYSIACSSSDLAGEASLPFSVGVASSPSGLASFWRKLADSEILTPPRLEFALSTLR